MNAKGDFDLSLPAAAPAPGAPPWLAAVRGRASLRLTDSVLAGVPLNGEASLRSDAGGPARAALDLVADGNRVHAEGRLSTRTKAPDDVWTVTMAAPALARLAPWWQMLGRSPGLAGSIEADARVTGRWPDLSSSGQARVSALRVDSVAVQRADARWQLGTRLDAPIDAQLSIAQATVGQTSLETAQLTLKGTGRAHRLELRAESKASPPAWAQRLQAPVPAPRSASAAGAASAVAGAASAASSAGSSTPSPRPATALLQAEGGLFDGPGGAVAGWRGRIEQLAAGQRDATPWVRAGDVGLELAWGGADGAARATVQPGRAEVLGAALRWSRIAWRAGSAAGAGAARCAGRHRAARDRAAAGTPAAGVRLGRRSCRHRPPRGAQRTHVQGRRRDRAQPRRPHGHRRDRHAGARPDRSAPRAERGRRRLELHAGPGRRHARRGRRRGGRAHLAAGDLAGRRRTRRRRARAAGGQPRHLGHLGARRLAARRRAAHRCVHRRNASARRSTPAKCAART